MKSFKPGKFLDELSDPASLGKLEESELEALAPEVRRRIIETVANTGGHLAPSLGVVELTLAILAEFDLNNDKLIWDVGHQAYAYKLLTGRAGAFDTLRTLGGISGFPRRDESKYDHFGVGHSSTSISAALGLAMARDLSGLRHHVLAVIGDGSLTGGEAFEGLNLAGHMGKRLIVILNDNEMSISPNVGALSLFLSRTLSHRWVRQTRREALRIIRSIPRIGQKLAVYAIRGEWSFKSFFTPGMLFEALRFTYIGPVDGHDLPALRRNLQRAAAVEDGPVLLHVRTRKGKGYAPAENNPTLYHGVGHFRASEGCAKTRPKLTYTQVFAQTIVELGNLDRRILAITAAMPQGTGTDKFRESFPDRFVDTGICEQHAVTFAAGLASQGYRPYLAIYSTFLQRGYDQLVHDVCLQNLPVTFCIDRAGLVGEDGPTHHGAFDLAYLRHVPNMHILAPRNGEILRRSLATALNFDAPLAIRYPRGACPEEALATPLQILEPCKGELLVSGSDLLIVAAGSAVMPALEAAESIRAEFGLQISVFDPVWIKPLPERQILRLAQAHSAMLIAEEGSRQGGASSAVLELLADNNALSEKKIARLGLPDRFIEHGTQAQLRELAGVDARAIYDAAKALLERSEGRKPGSGSDVGHRRS